MYFRIDKKSPLGQQIADLMYRVHRANKQAFQIAKSLSDMEGPGVIIRHGYMCGLIQGIQFKSRPGPEFVAVQAKGVMGHYYHPSARECARKHSEITKLWYSIEDRIKDDDFNALFNLQSGSAGTLTWYSRPGMVTYPGCYILSVPGPWADTVEQFPADMQEILESEARRLEKTYREQQPVTS